MFRWSPSIRNPDTYVVCKRVTFLVVDLQEDTSNRIQYSLLTMKTTFCLIATVASAAAFAPASKPTFG